MKEVKIRLTEKMEAAVEAFKELWKQDYSTEEEVVIELLKNGIEYYITTTERMDKEEYKIITEIMENRGYKGRISDME